MVEVQSITKPGGLSAGVYGENIGASAAIRREGCRSEKKRKYINANAF